MSKNIDEPYYVNEEYLEFYRNYIYDLLPATYRERDVDNTLKEFLEIIGEQAAVIKQNIDDLWKNFYIDTSESWIIPYIGELLGSKIILNPSADNRTDIKKTIEWRKLKGTLSGIEKIAKNYAGVGISTKEFLQLCSRLPNLKSLDTNSLKPNFVNIKDQIPLLEHGTINDNILHTIDVRNPSSIHGWYHPKNVGMFVSLLHVYNVKKSESMKYSDFRYYFGSLHKNIDLQQCPLFDGKLRTQLSSQKFELNPLLYFGKDEFFSIQIKNIPAAVYDIQQPEPVELSDDPKQDLLRISSQETPNTDFVGLDPENGIRLIEARKFSNPERQYIITALYQAEDGTIHEIARLDTSSLPDNRFNLISTSDYSGTFLLCIEQKEYSLPGEFPETVISIRDSKFPHVDHKKYQENSIESKYQNALYVYLPKIAFSGNSEEIRVYLLVDKNGTTFFAKKYENNFVIDENKNPQRSLGQIYPPRMLSFSLDALDNFGEINRNHGIQIVDPSKFKDEFLIEAFAENISENVTWKLGELNIEPTSSNYKNSNEVWIHWNILNTSFNNQNSTLPSVEWTTHFKSIRYDGIIEPLQTEQTIFEDFLEGTDEEKNDKIIEIAKTALGYLIEDVDLIECVISEKFDEPKNCIEFNVNIKFKPLTAKEFTKKSSLIRDTIDENPLFINSGNLVLKIKSLREETYFPLSIIHLTNKYNQCKLVYLPEIKLNQNLPNYLRVSKDGSTFYNDMSPKNLARKSAGQIMPIPNRFPLQQRVPRYMDLSNWDTWNNRSVIRGEIAIDPQNSRFAFAEADGQVNDVSTSFNYGSPHALGSTTIDRYVDLTEWENKVNVPISKLLTSFPSNMKFITKVGHDGGANLFPSATFKTIDDALSIVKDNDILEILDNSTYDFPSIFEIPSSVSYLTIQGFTQKIPKIKLDKDETEELLIEGNIDTLKIYGLTFIGKKIKIKGNVKNLVLAYCTFNHHNDSEGVSIEFESNDLKNRKIFIFKTIMQGISLDDNPTLIIAHDSIIENFSGAAIKITSDNTKISNVSLEAERSNILSTRENYTVFNEVRLSDVILTGRISVLNGDNSWLRFSRYEPGSNFPEIVIDDKLKQILYKCTSDFPLFVSKVFGNPHYLYLHRLCSEKIVSGGEDSLSMGVYNKAYRFKLIENLNTKLDEYIPFGIKKSLIYTS